MPWEQVRKVPRGQSRRGLTLPQRCRKSGHSYGRVASELEKKQDQSQCRLRSTCPVNVLHP